MKNYFNQSELEKSIDANCGRIFRQCSISVMDTISDPFITFDKNGVSNYYHEYNIAEDQEVLTGKNAKIHIDEWIKKIKKYGEGKQYDCMLGVSGGVDSTYLAYLAKKYGLRVLCVHFDNGWNSELAVNNINNIVEKCGFELFTYVIDWEEFKDIQKAYFKANVIVILIDKLCIFQNKIKRVGDYWVYPLFSQFFYWQSQL